MSGKDLGSAKSDIGGGSSNVGNDSLLSERELAIRAEKRKGGWLYDEPTNNVLSNTLKQIKQCDL